eukprot:SAG31_NODE_2549_length_5519_cov_2.816605_3_plen_63_part_00
MDRPAHGMGADHQSLVAQVLDERFHQPRADPRGPQLRLLQNSGQADQRLVAGDRVTVTQKPN